MPFARGSRSLRDFRTRPQKRHDCALLSAFNRDWNSSLVLVIRTDARGRRDDQERHSFHLLAELLHPIERVDLYQWYSTRQDAR